MGSTSLRLSRYTVHQFLTSQVITRNAQFGNRIALLPYASPKRPQKWEPMSNNAFILQRKMGRASARGFRAMRIRQRNSSRMLCRKVPRLIGPAFPWVGDTVTAVLLPDFKNRCLWRARKRSRRRRPK